MDTNITPSDNFSVSINTNRVPFALEMTRFVADRILIPIIVCLGIAGNSCNIAVLSRPKMRTSTNVYLTNLAIFDMLYLIFMMTLSLVRCRDKSLDPSYYYYVPYGRALSDLFGNCGVWVTVCFTIERYIGVCHPMKGKAWCTVQKAKLLTFIVFIFCLLNTLPVAFEYEVTLVQESQQVVLDTTTAALHHNFSKDDSNILNNDVIYRSNEVRKVNITKNYRCGTSEFGKTESYQFGYYWWYIAVFTFIPLLLLLVFNIILIKSVCHANKRRKLLSQSDVLGDHGNQSIEQQKVTTMLISVVIIFLICQFPWAILLVYKVYLSALNIPQNKDHILIAGNVCNLLGLLNASINFILYSYFSSRFRRTFRKLICRWKKRKPSMTNLIIMDYPSRKSDFSKDSMATSVTSYRYRRSTVRETNPPWKHPHASIS